MTKDKVTVNEESIKELKIIIFDIAREQELLGMRMQQLDKVKIEKMKQLEGLEAEARESVKAPASALSEPEN